MRNILARIRNQRGHAAVEAAMLMPWFFLAGAGVLDVGFYANSLLSVENAARVAARYTSSSTSLAGSSAGACTYALRELNGMPNTRSLTTCNALPVIVTATSVTGVDNTPATQVSVTYQTPQMIPLPFLMGRFTVTRVVQMKVNNS
jgi:Flp pilus assembly protein TadG